MNAVRQIQIFNAGRDPERLALKYRAMRADTFGFLRGSCHLFYERLPLNGPFKSAPAAWICGDLHLENFGSYKGDNRLVYFDLNDFDEAVLAPASWELVRLLTSLHVGAARWSIDEAGVQGLARGFLEAYASALALGKAYWVERDTAQGVVRTLLDGLRERQRPHFLDTRTVLRRGRRVLRVDGRKALPASEAQRDAVIGFMQAFAKGHERPEFFEVLDVARRIAGTGSLGVDRYVILVRGKGSPDGNFLLDLKQALPSALLPRLKTPQPVWRHEAERVVTIQRRVQAVSMALLQPVLFSEAPYVLRALQPSEDRVAVSASRRAILELDPLLRTMGQLAAWGQLRSAGRAGSAIADELIEFGQRKKWRERLLLAAHDCAAQARRDAASFNAAWDDGAFRV